MPLTDLFFQLDYTSENCSDFVVEFYELALAQAISDDRTTYTFSAVDLKRRRRP